MKPTLLLHRIEQNHAQHFPARAQPLIVWVSEGINGSNDNKSHS